MNRRTVLRCLPAAAVAVAIAALPAVARSNITTTEDEVVALCEVCSRTLFDGDLACRDTEGVTFCETHAPTWNDLKAEQDELIASGEFESAYDDPEDAAWARESVLAHIEAGKGDVKHVWRL